MPRSHFPELETLAPERLHYAFGANCYQHAVLDQEEIYIHVEPFMADCPLNSAIVQKL